MATARKGKQSRKGKQGKRANEAPSPAGFRRADLAAYLARSSSGIDKLLARGEIPARYVATREDIAARYAEWEIVGPAESRDVDPEARYFTPHLR